jgi:hypothetical protein
MRQLRLLIVMFSVCVIEFAQSKESDDVLLAKTRALYDAPFTRSLVSFDCAVRFDWKGHFMETLGQVPPAAIPTLEQLQAIQHRVFVDRSGAVVSEVPQATDLTGVTHGADLERGLQAMISSGLNAWLPFSTNVILPLKPTKFSFQKEDTDYKLTMSGTNATEFIDGPGGYLLKSVKTTSDIGSDVKWESTFGYAYKDVQGFQLPAVLAVTQQATPETWRYSLNDCKAVTGITLKVGPPKQ